MSKLQDKQTLRENDFRRQNANLRAREYVFVVIGSLGFLLALLTVILNASPYCK